jgi:ABC-type uncharacterized transport system involved in gliding motility auxiliary subunit
VVVFNSLFAIDENFDAYGNGNIFINSVDWAAEQEKLVTSHRARQSPLLCRAITCGTGDHLIL